MVEHATGRTGDAVSQPQRRPEQDRAGLPPGVEQSGHLRRLLGIGRTAVTQVHRISDEGPARVVDRNQRKMQDPPQRLNGAEIRMLAPGQVREVAGRQAQAVLLGVLVVEQRPAPTHQRLAEAAEATLPLGDLSRRRQQGVLAARLFRQLVEEVAFAQTEGRERDIPALQLAQHAAQHQRRHRQGVAAASGDVFDARERRLAGPADQPCQLDRGVAGDGILMNGAQRMLALFHVQVRQIAPGTAHGIEGAPLARLQPVDLGQGLVDEIARRLPVVAAALHEPQRAERQRGRVPDHAVGHLHQFQAAAAKVAHDAVRHRIAGDDAEGGELGLFLAAQYPDRQTAAFLDRFAEGVAVRGLAYRRGRDELDTADPHGAGKRGEAHQVRHRQCHAFRAQVAAALQAAPQAAEHLLVIDHGRGALQPVEDHEADGIGADIDYRDTLVPGAAPGRGCDCCRLAGVHRRVRTSSAPGGAPSSTRSERAPRSRDRRHNSVPQAGRGL